MTGFYIILASALAALGIFSWIVSHFNLFGANKKKESPDSQEEPTDTEESTACCGQHLVCQKDKRLMAQSEIIYFDDEELDAYKGIAADQYDDEALALFSEVFNTVRPEEMIDWLNSLRMREIELPLELRDEALMIVSEQRS